MKLGRILRRLLLPVVPVSSHRKQLNHHLYLDSQLHDHPETKGISIAHVAVISIRIVEHHEQLSISSPPDPTRTLVPNPPNNVLSL